MVRPCKAFRKKEKTKIRNAFLGTFDSFNSRLSLLFSLALSLILAVRTRESTEQRGNRSAQTIVAQEYFGQICHLCDKGRERPAQKI